MKFKIGDKVRTKVLRVVVIPNQGLTAIEEEVYGKVTKLLISGKEGGTAHDRQMQKWNGVKLNEVHDYSSDSDAVLRYVGVTIDGEEQVRLYDPEQVEVVEDATPS